MIVLRDRRAQASSGLGGTLHNSALCRSAHRADMIKRAITTGPDARKIAKNHL